MSVNVPESLIQSTKGVYKPHHGNLGPHLTGEELQKQEKELGKLTDLESRREQEIIEGPLE